MMFFYSAHDRGHYTAYTRYGGTSLWYKYDDTKVTEVTSLIKSRFFKNWGEEIKLLSDTGPKPDELDKRVWIALFDREHKKR